MNILEYWLTFPVETESETEMSNDYCVNLIHRVIDCSRSDSWQGAVLEWEIIDCDEDDTSSSSCICGKENIRYLFTIRNTENGSILYPIGSSCIKKFDRDDLNEEATIRQKLFELFHAIKNRKFVAFSKEYFSRNLLRYLFKIGAFQANQYKGFSPGNDYEFMLKMFNKRSIPSDAQQKKISAIILNSIRPYLAEQLKNKLDKDIANLLPLDSEIF